MQRAEPMESVLIGICIFINLYHSCSAVPPPRMKFAQEDCWYCAFSVRHVSSGIGLSGKTIFINLQYLERMPRVCCRDAHASTPDIHHEVLFPRLHLPPQSLMERWYTFKLFVFIILVMLKESLYRLVREHVLVVNLRLEHILEPCGERDRVGESERSVAAED